MRHLRGPIGPLVACLALVLAVGRVVDVVQVRGRSMLPTLRPDDRLVVVRRLRPVRVGDVVLALDPRDTRRELVKRVAAIGPEGVTLHGDNASLSTDGRTFGALPATAIRWRAVARCWPLARAGRLPGPRVLPLAEG